mgnify:CR=1 FL=1
MVVTEIFTKDPAQVSLIEHDDVIQTIPANGTDQAFDEWVLPRRTRRCKHILYSQAFDPSLDSVTIDAIAVTYQIARRGIKWKRFHDLLGCPSGGGMLGHVKVHDFATVMTEDYEHIEHTKRGGRNGEEIHRGQVRDMIVEEGSPGLRRRISMTGHVLRNCGLRDLNA